MSRGNRPTLYACGILLALFAMALVYPTGAYADDSAKSDTGVHIVQVDEILVQALGQNSHAADGGTIVAPRICPSALSAVCDPASIEVGIDCGMAEMCGIEPCLCGTSDEWGSCACNGTKPVSPTVAYESSDEGIVKVVDAFGVIWLVPCGAGTAQVTCTPDLVHHQAQSCVMTVQVEGPTIADALLIILVAAVIAVVVLCVRATRSAARKKGEAEHE